MSEEPERPGGPEGMAMPFNPMALMGEGFDELLNLPGLLRELNENVAALVQELRAWRSQRK